MCNPEAPKPVFLAAIAFAILGLLAPGTAAASDCNEDGVEDADEVVPSIGLH